MDPQRCSHSTLVTCDVWKVVVGAGGSLCHTASDPSSLQIGFLPPLTKSPRSGGDFTGSSFTAHSEDYTCYGSHRATHVPSTREISQKKRLGRRAAQSRALFQPISQGLWVHMARNECASRRASAQTLALTLTPINKVTPTLAPRVCRYHKNDILTKSGAAPAPPRTTVGEAGGPTH